MLVDGTWRYGALRGWYRDDEGDWSGTVQWSAGEAQNRLDRFEAASIRVHSRTSARPDKMAE